MLKFSPILLALIMGVAMWFFSSWRLRRELDARSTPLTDPVICAHIACMARALGLERIPVHVYETPTINGLAAPDGRVFVTRGFLDRYRRGEITGEELASVIAHELGHVALGHSRRRMIDFAGQNAIRVALGMVLGRLIPFAGMWLANLAASLVAARLSRQDEFEADAYAAALMVKAGLGTGPQKSMFAKLRRLAPAGGAQFAWLMSHPGIADRIAAIETLEKGWQAGPPSEAAG
ncbi:MAG: peptidase M48 [Alphaproteobacteria bacterium]|nr:MAG: peptidase M48 [Alphaproteobacteria bacterium]